MAALRATARAIARGHLIHHAVEILGHARIGGVELRKLRARRRGKIPGLVIRLQRRFDRRIELRIERLAREKLLRDLALAPGLVREIDEDPDLDVLLLHVAVLIGDRARSPCSGMK